MRVPLEEWDIIIYDNLQAPVLYVRGEAGTTPLLGIPAQHVHGVLEVKATLNQSNTKKVTKKLQKIVPLLNPNNPFEHPSKHEKGDFLRIWFFTMAVFFETDVKSPEDYRTCLNNLKPLHSGIGFERALVLRNQNCNQSSGMIASYLSPIKEMTTGRKWHESSEAEPLDLSRVDQDMYSFILSCGYGVNMFPSMMMDLVERLNDGPITDVTGSTTDLVGYGYDEERSELSRLFPENA